MEVTTKQLLAPELRFPEFEERWEKIKLNRSLATNITKNKEGKYSKNEMLSVSSSVGVVNQIEYKGRSFAGVSVLPYNILLKNQIVYTKSPLRDYPYGIIKFNDNEDGIVSTLYATYDIKDGNNGYFIDYYFQHSHRLNKYLKPLVNIGAKNDMKVNNDKVLSDFVIFPKFPEQQKIASFLTQVDNKIAQLTKKKELLEQYKKGVMQKIFSQEIRFKDDNGNNFPKWEKKKLGEVSKRITQKNKIDNQNVLTISAQLGLISQLEFFNKSVSAKDLTGYYLLNKNDFAYNKSYSNGYPMGAIKRLTRYDLGVVSTLYICFRFLDLVSLEYMEQYFDSGLQNKEIKKVAQEGARNHGLLNIGVHDFFDIQILLPNKEEQTKIANFLKSIDKKIEQVNTQLIQAQTWKKGLLQKMFV